MQAKLILQKVVNKVVNYDSLPLFRLAVKVVVDILVFIIIVTLFIGLGRIILQMYQIFNGMSLNAFLNMMIASILSLLVVIELFKGFIEYYEAKRFRLHSLIDSGIVFVLRELFLQLFEGKIYKEIWSFLGFATILISLSLVRTLAIKISPEKGGRVK
ncbi:MAG: phosphate-starvation-inducible PsiE family protein [Candidatus Desulfofervidaceae bacterium]|nr:phosphate-starvation-inducible PsiE family protein [Candidatus Desulfofervidaceae bacterium]